MSVLVLEQRVVTDLLAAALVDAVHRIEALTFPLGFPVEGYGQAQFLELLKSFEPKRPIEAWTTQARELLTS